MPQRRPTVAERFWNKIDWTKTGDCWSWIGAHDRNGYGRFNVSPERGLVSAHAFARELVLGERVPVGLWALHHCDVPNCVNPDHIYFGSHRDNVRDMIARGRDPFKLSFSEVCEIREATGTHAAIAARFGIAKSYVTRLRQPAKYGRRVSQ